MSLSTGYHDSCGGRDSEHGNNYEQLIGLKLLTTMNKRKQFFQDFSYSTQNKDVEGFDDCYV